MAAEGWGDPTALKRRLFEQPHRFEFFQAVRLLNLIAEERDAVGRSPDPDREAVRFRSALTLSFARTDIAALLDSENGGEPPELTVSFMGAATPQSFGSLPDRYTKEILERVRARNPVARDFLDVFNHRVVSLFYRAWEKYRLPICYENRTASAFEEVLFSVIGMATPGLQGRIGLDDRALLSRAGLLAMAPAPVVAIESLVESYFGVPATCVQFVPRRYAIDPGDRTRLGMANASLGVDTVAGETVQLVQSQFRMRLGPMPWDAYAKLLPSAPGFRALVDLVRLAVGPDLDFDVQPVLRREDVPGVQLGAEPDVQCRLGWSTWLKGEDFQRDADDALLSSEIDLAAIDAAVAGSPGMEASA